VEGRDLDQAANEIGSNRGSALFQLGAKRLSESLIYDPNALVPISDLSCISSGWRHDVLRMRDFGEKAIVEWGGGAYFSHGTGNGSCGRPLNQSRNLERSEPDWPKQKPENCGKAKNASGNDNFGWPGDSRIRIW
jgi:hypothetical protein